MPDVEPTTLAPPSVVVITGSSSGIGLATVQMFLGRGWTVVGLDRAEASAELKAQPEFRGLVADVTDTDSVDAAFATLAAEGVVPTALVNAAGIYPKSEFPDTDFATYRRIFDLNVWGTVAVSQAFVRVCPDRARIANIASRDAYLPPTNQYLYSASKAAIVNLTAATALALLPRGIAVNAVSPPRVATEALRAIYGGVMPEDAVPVENITSVIWAMTGGADLTALNGQIVRIPATGEVEF